MNITLKKTVQDIRTFNTKIEQIQTRHCPIVNKEFPFIGTWNSNWRDNLFCFERKRFKICSENFDYKKVLKFAFLEDFEQINTKNVHVFLQIRPYKYANNIKSIKKSKMKKTFTLELLFSVYHLIKNEPRYSPLKMLKFNLQK